MHFQFLAPVLLLASAAFAAPVTPDVASIAPASDAPLDAPLDAAVLETRKNGKGVLKLYQGDNRSGDFGEFRSDNVCHNVKKKKTHSSFKMWNAQCHFYDGSNCKGTKATVRSGPNESLDFELKWVSHIAANGFISPPNWWNNRISSVICWDY